MITFFKNNRTSLFLAALFLTIYGVISLFTIPKEATPSVNIPYYVVSVVYAGADPATLEEQVVNKLEQRFKSITLIKQITSTSSSNVGIISLEFYPTKKDNDASNDIKAAIDQIYPTLPSDVRMPSVKKVDISNMAIYTFSVAAHYPPAMIYDRIKTLENKLKSIPGVSEITVIGKPTREIKVLFNADKLAALDMDVATVITILKGAFVKTPADKKEVSNKLFSFEIANYEQNLSGLLEQIKQYDIISKDGKSIKVQDVAEVNLSYKVADKASYVFTNRKKQESMNALSFQITKVPGYSIETLTNELKLQVEEFALANPEFQFVETTSLLESIQRVYNLFMENFWETAILVFIIVFLFLGMKSSIIILISFLVVYLADFGFLKSIGYTFNNIVSFSLILVLGVMIDNLIVIMQGIVTGLRKYKNNIWLAIADSLKNYARPIIFGTSTTIAIFVPLYFVLSGIMGEFMKPMPVTIISNLAISLIITLIILPVISTYFYKATSLYTPKKLLLLLEKSGKKFAQWFSTISATRWGAFKVLSVFIVFFIGALSLFPLGIIKTDFMGNMDSNNVWINITYPPGITLQDNQRYTNELSHDILSYIDGRYPQAIDHISLDLGSQNSSSMSLGGGSTNNLASFTLRLVPGEERTITSYAIVEDLQQFFTTSLKKKYTFIKDISPLTQKAGPSSGKPVGFYIEGKDYEKINAYIQSILPSIKKISGIYNVNASIEYTNGKIKYILDENMIKRLGISNASIMLTMISLKNSEYEPNGIKIKDFSEFGDDSLSLVAFLTTMGDFDDLKIGKIYLSQVVKEKRIEPELTSISKLDGEKVILVEADKLDSVPLSDITPQIDTIIQNTPLPEGLSYVAAGDVQSQSDAVQDLGIAMVIGLLLMYMVLIVQFNKVKYATVILTSVFISVGGSVALLALLGFNFSFVAQIGIFGVLGVGVNQALIHIEDFKEYYEKRGMSVVESFKMSIAERFVPIFLTKLVTIIGLLILAFKDEMFGSMAWSFIGGLLVSFFINLIYIPSFMRFISRDYYHKEKRESLQNKGPTEEIDEVFTKI